MTKLSQKAFVESVSEELDALVYDADAVDNLGAPAPQFVGYGMLHKLPNLTALRTSKGANKSKFIRVPGVAVKLTQSNGEDVTLAVTLIMWEKSVNNMIEEGEEFNLEDQYLVTLRNIKTVIKGVEQYSLAGTITYFTQGGGNVHGLNLVGQDEVVNAAVKTETPVGLTN